MIYKNNNYQRNHAIFPEDKEELERFLGQSYKGMQHKKRNACNSHSEDALTWSCFRMLFHLPLIKKITALDEILEDAYRGKPNFTFKNYSENEIIIEIGKEYIGQTIKNNKKESTEVDASIELPDKLIFFEAKLYSSISLADKENKKEHDQIAKKLRVGLDCCGEKEFYFIFLDIAPPEKLLHFTNEKKSKENALMNSKGKWKSAWWFNYYKFSPRKSKKPLTDALTGINYPSIQSVKDNMGWITWSDLYKNILRGMIKN